jgi:hypothetical protein
VLQAALTAFTISFVATTAAAARVTTPGNVIVR